MKYIMLDTETANSIDDPLCYDIGFAVIDETGKVYDERNFVVADIYLDKELMSSAYYAKKLPQYEEELKSGIRKMAKLSTIKKVLAQLMREYSTNIVVAHNARFDYRSTTKTQRYITKSENRYFFPYGTEIWDTLKMAREVLREDEEYENFCYENGYLTKRGCRRYTAEILYRFS